MIKNFRSRSENGVQNQNDEFIIVHNERGEGIESSDLCPSEDFDSVQKGEEDVAMEFSTTPAQITIPRKASLFRVLMERKLGIDWEHS
jgi:hypothetical protein